MNHNNLLSEGFFDILKKLFGVRKSISGMNKHVGNLEKILNKKLKAIDEKPIKLQRFEFSDFVNKKS